MCVCVCVYIYIFFPPLVLRLDAGYGHILEVSRSHKMTHHSRLDYSGRTISSPQRRLPDNTQHSQQISLPLAEFESTVPAGERPQIYAIDRAITGIGWHMDMSYCVCRINVVAI